MARYSVDTIRKIERARHAISEQPPLNIYRETVWQYEQRLAEAAVLANLEEA